MEVTAKPSCLRGGKISLHKDTEHTVDYIVGTR